jgi:hypothetical protein
MHAVDLVQSINWDKGCGVRKGYNTALITSHNTATTIPPPPALFLAILLACNPEARTKNTDCTLQDR